MSNALTIAALLVTVAGALILDHALIHLVTYLQMHTSKLEHYFDTDVPDIRELLYNPLVRQEELRDDLLWSNTLAVDTTARNYLYAYRAGIIVFGIGIVTLAISYFTA